MTHFLLGFLTSTVVSILVGTVLFAEQPKSYIDLQEEYWQATDKLYPASKYKGKYYRCSYVEMGR